MTLKQMRERYHRGIPDEASAILARAKSEGREPTDDEVVTLEGLKAEQDRLAGEISTAERRARAVAAFATAAAIPATPNPDGSVPAAIRDGAVVTSGEGDHGPFRTFGEQLQAIFQAGVPGGYVDDRLFKVRAATGASALVGSDGAFLIQKDFSTALLARAQESAVLWPRTDQIPIGDNADGLEAPYIDETSRANGSRWGGVQVYRRAEAATVAASKPKIGKFTLDLEEMIGLFYATDRLLRDASALGAIVEKAFRSEIAFAMDDEIYRGNGVGKCLGILNSAALVTVSKEAGPQAAGTFVAANAAKMYARMPASLIGGAVWLCNQDVLPQLTTMTLGQQPIYLPAGTIASAPYGMLMGRPVVPIEHAETVGTKGDVAFVNLDEYAVIGKDGIQAADSMHVKFVEGEKAFRWTLRSNGAPKWKSAKTPYKGSNALSPFVVLETR